jgi:hypothetical protein
MLMVVLGAGLVVVVDTTGAQVVQGILDVHELGPTFRANAVAAARTTHRDSDRPSGRDSARAARAALAEGRR